jgi:hypothetical protein
MGLFIGFIRLASGWLLVLFILREKYYWLVANKADERDE